MYILKCLFYIILYYANSKETYTHIEQELILKSSEIIRISEQKNVSNTLDKI